MKKLIILFIAITLSACGHKEQTDKKILTVTLEPLRFFTEAIAGNNYQVVSMVPEGNSPETYDPVPQQLINLSQSLAYLRIGYIGFEKTWMEKITANHPRLQVFDTSQGVDLIRSEEHHHVSNVEPHIWNSTRNASIVADNICHALSHLDVAHQDFYRHRTDSLKEVIARTDSIIRMNLQKADSTFLIFHPALSYFAKDYGLEQISIEEEGKEPTPTQLKKLIRSCKEKNIRVIFVQKEFDTRNAALIAEELGLSIVSINPLSYDWPKEMIHIAQSLAK